MHKTHTVAEIKNRVKELGFEIPPGVVEKSELLAFLERAEARAGTADNHESPLSPGGSTGSQSVASLKNRLRELGFDVPLNIVEKRELVALVEEAERQKAKANTQSVTKTNFRPKPSATIPVPPPWVRTESRSRPGCFYYVNNETHERTWEPWFKQESRSRKGLFYYINVETGETTWDAPTSRLKEAREEVHVTRKVAAPVSEEEPQAPTKVDYRDDAFADCNAVPSSSSNAPKKRTSLRCNKEAPGGNQLVKTLSFEIADDWEKSIASGQPASASAAPPTTTPSSAPTIEKGIQGSQFTWVKGPLIGRGSLGRVYKAVNQSTGQIIAVKEVQISAADEHDNQFKESLKNEVEIMKAVQHPRIVNYIGHDYIDHCLFVYLEHMPGGTLTSALNEFGAFDESLIKKYTFQLLEGLDYLHTRDPPIIHRDLKGANVLLSGGEDCSCKLADFGCSKRTDCTMTHTMRGSIPWMAPEVIAHSQYGRSSDIWSFGCVVIEMATAAVPWGRFENQMAALVKIGLSQETPPMPEGRSEECTGFILECVNRDQSLRPSANDLMSHAFVRVEGDG